MGSKVDAKALVAAAGVPVLPSWAAGEVPADARYPLLVKASYGGGGRGMRVVRAPGSWPTRWRRREREATAAFGNGLVFVERWLERSRHVEVQVLADTHGTVVAVGERDCSVQRRHQKIVEEAPRRDRRTRCGSGCSTPRSRPPARSATWAPAPSSSSSTPTASRRSWR